MNRSESNAELLVAQDHSTPSKVEEFIIPELGGGFIVANLYGDFGLSIGPVDFGVLGNSWPNPEEALDYLCGRSNTLSDKCIVTDLKVGGCAMLLYFLSPELDTPTNRRRLTTALVKELPAFVQTKILCIPGKDCSLNDMVNIYKANETLTSLPKTLSGGSLASLNEDPLDTSPMAGTHSRASSLAATTFDFPVPSAMITPEAQRDNLVVKASSQSVLGAISTLTKANHWALPHIFLMGYSALTRELYWLLKKADYEIWVSDPNPDAFTDSKIDPSSVIAWNDAITTKCDVLVFCTADCPKLTEKIVDTLSCRAVMSASHFLLPRDEEKLERVRIALERKGIFEFCDGLSDLGSIAMVYSMSHEHHISTTKEMIELGSQVMQKKLHLDGIVKEYDTEDKRKFYSMVLADEVDDIGGLKLGLGTIIHNSSDSMTQWMWTKARSLCPAFRALNTAEKEKGKKKDIHYVDLGAGNGSAARWICKQDKHIHVKCINISPQQNAENRHLSDEQGLGGQVAVETASFERLPSEYSCWFDGCISQDAFIHAYNKLHALSEAFRVTKGGGWLMVSDLMCGEADVSPQELKTFVEKNNVQNWVTPSQYVTLTQEAGWSEVQFIDCTPQIKVSLQSLLEKIKTIITSGEHKGLNLKLLQTHRLSLGNRIGQIDRGVFKWGIIAGRKPYDVLFMTNAPVTPVSHPMMFYSTNNVDGSLKFGTDVVVLNIKDQMKRAKIMELPSTTRLIVTMSAGLDHIDMDAATERGIRVRRAARFQIVKSVADYLLSNIIFGLRNGYQNVGVPFPGKKWDL
jgi:sarcosine/dimethylglycine N-methyltransferase